MTGGVSVPLTLAWVNVDTPVGPMNWEAAPSSFFGCTVHIDRRLTPHQQTARFPFFCGLIVHEYGHLLGWPDRATDPVTSITYPIIGRANERVAPCVERYWSYADS
jgi:hypothetical protein